MTLLDQVHPVKSEVHLANGGVVPGPTPVRDPHLAVVAILAHPNPGSRIDFAMSARAEPAQRARLADDPSFKVRAALAYGPEVYEGRNGRAAPGRCVRLPARRPRACRPHSAADSPHLAPSVVASTSHPRAAARREAESGRSCRRSPSPSSSATRWAASSGGSSAGQGSRSAPSWTGFSSRSRGMNRQSRPCRQDTITP